MHESFQLTRLKSALPPVSREEPTDIALQLREKVDLGPQQRYRLVGIGLSNFHEVHVGMKQLALF